VVLGSVLFLIGTGLLFVWLPRLLLLVFAIWGMWLVTVIAFGYLVGVAGHIYRAALYVYATEGVVPVPYTAELMDAAWKVKKH
jgi:hypothetical protein